MKLWNEFQSKVLPLYGAVSVALLAFYYIVGKSDMQFMLLAAFIYVTITYYFNNKILAKYINMNGDKIIFYVVYSIETAVFVFILRIIIDLTKHGEICFYCIFRSVGIVIIFMSAANAIIYFSQKAYTKRMNKKLDEYKQNNDDK